MHFIKHVLGQSQSETLEAFQVAARSEPVLADPGAFGLAHARRQVVIVAPQAAIKAPTPLITIQGLACRIPLNSCRQSTSTFSQNTQKLGVRSVPMQE